MENSTHKTLAEHFIELRKRVIISTLAVAVTTLISFLWVRDIIYLLCLPLVRNKRFEFIYTGLTDAFVAELRVALLSGIFLATPIITYQIWQFVKPGLHTKERWLLKGMVLVAPLLFLAGMAFSYYIAIPSMWQFFSSFEWSEGKVQLKLLPGICSYLSTTTNTLLVFGLSFQLPLIVFALNRLNIVAMSTLRSARKYVFLLVMVLAALLTPPDVMSMIVLGIPVYLLYETTVLLLILLERKEKAHKPLVDEEL